VQSRVSPVVTLGLELGAVSKPAVRRWGSADGSQLHEQAKAGGVGESLEPGGDGAVWPIRNESEVA
jgi:hypothetical protein